MMAVSSHTANDSDKADARKLLNDEFVCFAIADIEQVLKNAAFSFAKAWHMLSDAESEGYLAKNPIEYLAQTRGSPVTVADVEMSLVQSPQLKAELLEVQQFWRKSRCEFSCWASGLMYSSDKDGKEQLLDADGKQVMMEWERPYMEGCVEALRIGPDCDVLEIGFGCAYSADWIQRAQPRSHTIIECSPPVLERLHAWASTRPNVRVVEGTWQERLPDLGTFDCVFFDDYGEPGVAEREMEENCPNPEYRKEYFKALNAQNGTHFHAFLGIVTQWHSHVGTRISGYLHYPLEMQRNDLQAVYKHIDVKVPDHCNYFPGQNLWPYALVPLFVKRDAGWDDEEDTTAGSHSSARSQSASRSRSKSRSMRRGISRSRSRSARRRVICPEQEQMQE